VSRPETEFIKQQSRPKKNMMNKAGITLVPASTARQVSLQRITAGQTNAHPRPGTYASTRNTPCRHSDTS